jgi:hypothetical protein
MGGLLPRRHWQVAGRWPVGGGGVAGEQAGGVTDQFGGRKEGRGSPEGFSVAEGINGREKTVARRSRGHRRSLSGLGGSTQWLGAWGGVEMTREGLEQLFTVAQVGRRGTTAVAQTWGCWRWLAGCRGSGRRCRARGGVGEFGGGPGRRFERLNNGGMTAQWRRRGGGGKWQFTGGVLLL